MSRDNDPATPGALLAEAVDAYARGDLRATRSKSRLILIELPAHADAWRLAAYAHLGEGPAVGLGMLERAAAARPDSPDTWNDIASVAQRIANPLAAVRALRRATALDPGASGRWRDLGVALSSLGGDGTGPLYRSLALADDDGSTLRALAEALLARDEIDAARRHACQALLLLPADAGSWLVLGLQAHRGQSSRDADRAFRRAGTIVPEMASAWHNLALVASAAGDFPGTDRGLRRALAAEPAFAHSLLLSGNRRIEVGDTSGASVRFRRVQAVARDFPEATLNLSMITLLDGDCAAGWRGFSARWRCASHRHFRPTPGARAWDGRVDRAARLVLRAEPEQALGDTIQFARFIPSAAERVSTVIVECAHTLHGLIGRMPGVSRVIDIGSDPGTVDLSCGLMELGAIFAPTLAALPFAASYLAPDPTAVAAWALQIDDLPQPRIGICWRGNPRFRMDRHRSPGYAAVSPLLRIAGPHLLSLVLDRREEEPLPDGMADPMPLVSDMFDTAALISTLDLVITSDTAIAHLSGALGRPTWVLLHEPPDWRWLRDRTDSPWYPSVRLFRQPSPGDWSAVIVKVIEMLDASFPIRRQ